MTYFFILTLFIITVVKKDMIQVFLKSLGIDDSENTVFIIQGTFFIIVMLLTFLN